MTAQITKDEVASLAQLARIMLSEDELVALQHDISNILGYVSQVAEVAGVGSEQQVGALYNSMRDDKIAIDIDLSGIMVGKEEVLRQAFPRREGPYNVVRKIIQKDE